MSVPVVLLRKPEVVTSMLLRVGAICIAFFHFYHNHRLIAVSDHKIQSPGLIFVPVGHRVLSSNLALWYVEHVLRWAWQIEQSEHLCGARCLSDHPLEPVRICL